MLSLNKCLEAKDWDKLMDDVFSNQKIIKLGCNLLTDIQMIVNNNRGSKDRLLRFTHILDMAIFFEKLQEVYPVEMSTEENIKHPIGLSQLCKVILGKPLSKEERLCDWEKRPLSDSQLEYAALDAHCLLQIFDEIKNVSSEKNMNFNHLVKVAMVMTSGHSKVKRKLKEEKKSTKSMNEKPIPIDEFHVVVQPQLKFISKSLKEMGANVLVLQFADKASDAALIAKTQGRFLICFEDFKRKVKNISSEVVCYSVNCDSGNSLELQKILQKANVFIDDSKLLQTCQNCSSADITQLSMQEFSYFKELESLEDVPSENGLSNSLLRTIYEMKKAGVKLKLKNQKSISNESVFLCKKCGLVQ
ncbi:exonuclease mut-7 homolog isoform X2 [Parasteatoda tepidariorum]|uniref:exonuclease mut-7 homolog isoform X2 n=1 Tax=Parasteatoda tepidariorum TaxID=114398 RepID=UPI00077F8AD9|nr:exonuclease mut-7 homolog isoform X2 [Parasteatoda tepidariorum]